MQVTIGKLTVTISKLGQMAGRDKLCEMLEQRTEKASAQSQTKSDRPKCDGGGASVERPVLVVDGQKVNMGGVSVSAISNNLGDAVKPLSQKKAGPKV